MQEKKANASAAEAMQVELAAARQASTCLLSLTSQAHLLSNVCA